MRSLSTFALLGLGLVSGVTTSHTGLRRELATVQLDSSVAAPLALGADYVYVRANRVYALGS